MREEEEEEKNRIFFKQEKIKNKLKMWNSNAVILY
jgi:hypothetical protein